MLKQFVLYIFLLTHYCYAQTWVNVTTDYINNPSFEEYYACPQGFSTYPNSMWIDSCKFWYAPTLATSDYYNSCNVSTSYGIPLNTATEYQHTFHGEGYCGFYAYSAEPFLWCEYIQTKLIKKLQKDELYSFTMRINRGNGYNFSVKNIGANFTKNDKKNYTASKPFNFIPTILNNTGFLNDTLGWTLVSGSFIATGDEEYLTIGWFGDTITSDYTFFIPPDTVPSTGELLYIPRIYYLVDSLTLSATNKKNITRFDINTFTPNNDGVNDVIDFSLYYLSNIDFNVFNRWGNLVFSSKDITLKWQGNNNNNEPLHDGVYYYVINAEVPEIKEKINKVGYLSVIH